MRCPAAGSKDDDLSHAALHSRAVVTLRDSTRAVVNNPSSCRGSTQPSAETNPGMLRSMSVRQWAKPPLNVKDQTVQPPACF
jgi:hypothetical protein